MVRTIIKPDTSRINLSIPSEYVGEEVEILIFPLKSASDSNNLINYTETNSAKKQKSFSNFMKLKGILPADFDYNKELSDYRDERHGHIN
ncbi:MAG: hypothetical protein FWB86_13030 [Treponema sp.]|nr:hypothetical protein [Treponema sp.]MCL2252380.1 hypothetical protein [Treponema sp.]